MEVDEKSARELERLFALPIEDHAAAPPRYKVAFVVWVAVFPSVLVVSILLALLPFEMPLVLAVFVNTAISVPPVVYILLPWLCRLFDPWVYKESGTAGDRNQQDPPSPEQ